MRVRLGIRKFVHQGGVYGFGRSGAALEALKKVPRTSYDTAWESGGGAMQGALGHATRVFEGI